MLVRGKRPVSHLIATLSNIAGVLEVGKVNDESKLEQPDDHIGLRKPAWPAGWLSDIGAHAFFS
jgi:hypothetical protein